MMRYYYKLSKSTWIISLIVSLVLVIAAKAVFQLGTVYGYVIGTLLASVLIISFGLMPIYLEEDERKYKLRLTFFSINLNKADYSTIQISPDEFDRSIRTFGSGGLFGFTGMFYSKQMGHYRAFIANPNRPLLLLTKGNKKIIINAPN